MSDSRPSDQKSVLESSNNGVPHYVTEAAMFVVQAIEFETLFQFEKSFVSYKSAIACLLNGVQEDGDENRRAMVQNKASQYLLRAEHIYHTHLSCTSNNSSGHGVTSHALQITDTRNSKSQQRSMSDLQNFRVLGVVSSVILALDSRSDKPYIIKVLQKTPCPKNRHLKSIVPSNVPFMCQLHCYMENEYAVFLVLEQACEGQLWDHISAYFQAESIQGSPTPIRRLFEKPLKNSSQNFDCILDTSLKEKSEENSFLESNLTQIAHSLNPSAEDNIKTLEQSEERTRFDVSDEIVQVDPNSSKENNSCSPFSKKNNNGHSVLQEEAEEKSSILAHSSADVETHSLLRNARKLLASVNTTLSKSEKLTKTAMNALKRNTDSIVNANENHQARYTLHVTSRERKSSTSRERKTSSSRRPRSHVRFSCDDMFEGRARALSRSVDRQAVRQTRPPTASKLPIDTIRLWAAELLLALEALHRWGVIIGDLQPKNLLLGRGFNLLLTYQCIWMCVDQTTESDAMEELYAAPEMSGIHPVTAAADWWSFGAILYELLTGETLGNFHPSGFFQHTVLHIPASVPDDARNLLMKLLQYEPEKRLGSGPNGVLKLKEHDFFKNIDWNNVLLLSASV